MLRATLRPAASAVRQLSTQSFQTPSRSHTTRNATIASLTLLAAGGVVYSSRSRTLLADERVRTSVLDQDSLKENIHSRPGSDEGQALVEGKQKEAEGSSEGAFNEETGEINWDCPCLGGMADGPCGENFKAAFSCFVFSEAEPKGIDCVDRFKNMQDCFREHPDIYGEEIDDDAESEPISGTVSAETNTTDAPRPPNPNPPVNSPILGSTPSNQMTKNESRLMQTNDKERHKAHFDDEEAQSAYEAKLRKGK